MSTVAVRALIHEKTVWIPGVAIIALNLLAWVYLAATIRPSDDLLILHYNIHFGVDYLGRWFAVFAPPFVGVLFAAVNAVLVWWFWLRFRMLSHIALAVTVVIQGTVLGVAALLVALNT